MNAFMLLVDNGTEQHSVLEEALAPLGSVQFATRATALEKISKNRYDVIIVDSTSTIDDTPLLVTRIRSQQADARILVVTSSPTWRRARAAFRAGAVDYVRKTSDATTLRATVQDILTNTP